MNVINTKYPYIHILKSRQWKPLEQKYTPAVVFPKALWFLCLRRIYPNEKFQPIAAASTMDSVWHENKIFPACLIVLEFYSKEWYGSYTKHQVSFSAF